MSNIQSEIKEMAQLALLSGRITDFHVTNLKTYGFVFFNGVEKIELDYDLTVGDKSIVTYKLNIDDKLFNDKLEKRFQALETATRNLFWKDLRVRVYVNNKLAFESV